MTRDDRLRQDYERVKRLYELNRDHITFETDRHSPPQAYRMTMRCQGLRTVFGEFEETDKHEVHIFLGPDYPNKPPDLIWSSQTVHPNIRAYAACLLEGWGAETPLDVVCLWLWDMARYRIVNLSSPLDPAVARWAAQHLKEFPLDPRTLMAVSPEMSEPQTEGDSAEAVDELIVTLED